MNKPSFLAFSILVSAAMAKAVEPSGEARRQFVEPVAQAMQGNNGAQLDLALAHRKAAYVWMRVAEHFQKENSRVTTIMANKMEQMFVNDDERKLADEEAEQLIRQIEKERPGVSEIEGKAMRGDTEAQAELVFIYSLGFGVQRDEATALKWAAVADAFGYEPPVNDRLKLAGAGVNETTLQMTARFHRASPKAIARAQAQARGLVEKIKSAKSSSP